MIEGVELFQEPIAGPGTVGWYRTNPSLGRAFSRSPWRPAGPVIQMAVIRLRHKTEI